MVKVTANNILSYPGNLSNQMMQALKMVCESGLTRIKAAEMCGVDPVEVGIIMRRHGLRRAPPKHIVKALQRVEAGESLRSAAKSVKVNHNALRAWRDKLQVPANPGKALEAHRYAKAHGLTAYEAAAKFDLSYNAIIRIASYLNEPLKRPSRRWEILRERNQSIAMEYARGKTLREIGTMFGISHERVRQVIMGLKNEQLHA